MNGSSTLTPTRPRVDFDRDVDEQLRARNRAGDFTGWWCIRTDPFRCPAVGCDFVTEHCTAAHRILVWPEQDDPRLLSFAALVRDVHRNPRVVSYEVAMGPCITWDAWCAINRPIHATAYRGDES